MNLPKFLAVVALVADALTWWFVAGRPVVGTCWALAAIAVTLFIPAR